MQNKKSIELSDKKCLLLPKQLEEHGLSNKDLKIGKRQLEKIVEGYTRESGVRSLEKQIAKVVRYAAKSIAMEEEYNVTVTNEDVEKILGPARLERDKYENNDVAGVVTGHSGSLASVASGPSSSAR